MLEYMEAQVAMKMTGEAGPNWAEAYFGLFLFCFFVLFSYAFAFVVCFIFLFLDE